MRPIAGNSGDKIIYQIEIDNSKNDKKPPTSGYKITGKLVFSESDLSEDIIIQIPLNVNVLFTETGKLLNKPFVDFFSANKDNAFNISHTYTNLNIINSEDILKDRLEKNNIFLVAKQSKFDPPLIYYSCSISGTIPIILECSFQKNALKIRIISSMECISNLMKEVIDIIVN